MLGNGGPYVQENKPKLIHTGLVVYSNYRIDDKIIKPAVLDLDDLQLTGYLKILRVSHEAFKIPPAKMNCELSVRKNLERRLGKPLLFGNLIEFDYSQCNKHGEITSFERVASIIQSRSHQGKCQILLDGIINPEDPEHFYTEYFRNIRLPSDKKDEAIPNVLLQAWITIDYMSNNTITYEFDSFHGVCDIEKQIDIGTAPWNRGLDRFQIIPICNDSDEEDDGYGGCAHLLANAKKRPGRPELELYKVEGYVTGDRSFWLLQYPAYKCVNPLKKKNLDIPVGSLWLVNCIWNHYEKFYMVTNVVKSKKHDTLPVDPTSNMLRCSVRANENYRGIFRNEQFGFMDDPQGLLSLIHLTKYKASAIPVTFSDAGPSKNGQLRFRIEKIIGDKQEKLKTYLENEKISINKVSGVVIGDGFVYSGEHCIKVKFDEDDTPPSVGVRIKFNAVYDIITKTFIITQWNVVEELKPLVVEKRLISRALEKFQLVFKVKAKICKEKDLNKMLWCEEFGIIDDNLGFVTLDTKNPHAAVYNVWVASSELNNDNFVPRTHFHIVGTGDKPPKDCPETPKLSASHLENRRIFEETVKTAAQELKVNQFPLGVSGPTADQSSESQDGESISSFGKSSSSSRYNTDAWGNSRSASSFGGFTRNAAVFPNNSGNFSCRDHNSDEIRRGFNQHFESMRLHSSSLSSKIDGGSDFTVKKYFDMDNESHRTDHASVRTEDGGIDPARHPSRRKDIPEYTGVVLAPPNEDGHLYDIVETLSRLKAHVPHGDCGTRCSPECPYISELAHIIVREENFWAEVQARYPSIANVLMKSICAVESV